MKRLTFEGNFCDIAQCRELPCKYDGGCAQKEVWERLKAYEDSGCEPEEVLPKGKACEIALNLMRLAGLESLCSYDRLRELAEADKEGRVVVLPCKVGDVLYAAESAPVIPLHVMEVAIYLALEGEDDGDYERISNIGKTVFLTRAEAEKALQEME